MAPTTVVIRSFALRDHIHGINFPLVVSMRGVKKVRPFNADYRETISSSTMTSGVGFERSGTLK